MFSTIYIQFRLQILKEILMRHRKLQVLRVAGPAPCANKGPER